VNSFNDVEIFMNACDQKEIGFSKQSDLYVKLIEEEFGELIHAYLNKDMVEIADACADLKWVIEGLEYSLNIPQQDVWNEVAASNLNKISQTGKVLKREDGKVIKPAGWKPPDIVSILKEKM